MTHPHPRALEAAARALHEYHEQHESDYISWDKASDAMRYTAREDARAAVSAYIAALQETHALVPRLPNADMAAAGQWAIQNPVGFPPDNRRIITSQQVWIAMIDAAPPAAQDPRP